MLFERLREAGMTCLELFAALCISILSEAYNLLKKDAENSGNWRITLLFQRCLQAPYIDF